MTEYHVTFPVIAEQTFKVKANSPKEAVELCLDDKGKEVGIEVTEICEYEGNDYIVQDLKTKIQYMISAEDNEVYDQETLMKKNRIKRHS